MSTATVLAILTLVIGVPLNVYMTRRLWGLHRSSPENEVLRERGIVETAVLLIVIVFGIIFLFNDKLLPIPFLDTERTKLITRAAILALAVVPATYWLWLYRE